MIGTIEIDSGNVEILRRVMVEEAFRDDISICADDGTLRIDFRAGDISDARAAVNALINDLACAERLLEV